jgi:manganese/iron transport system ATP-binding protein
MVSLPQSSIKEIVASALQRVGIWELRHRQIGELSGGQQQRVFLARAIAQQAELFLFDEPLAGIDKKTEAIIFQIFAELKAEGKTLLVSSHEWGKTLSQYDRLLLLNQRLVANGSPQDVMTLENIQRAMEWDYSRISLTSVWGLCMFVSGQFLVTYEPCY